jgi:hypothetical protein
MHLFKSDLYRSLAFGFAAGAVVVFTTLGGWAGDSVGKEVMPSAVAAPVQ